MILQSSLPTFSQIFLLLKQTNKKIIKKQTKTTPLIPHAKYVWETNIFHKVKQVQPYSTCLYFQHYSKHVLWKLGVNLFQPHHQLPRTNEPLRPTPTPPFPLHPGNAACQPSFFLLCALTKPQHKQRQPYRGPSCQHVPSATYLFKPAAAAGPGGLVQALPEGRGGGGASWLV